MSNDKENSEIGSPKKHSNDEQKNTLAGGEVKGEGQVQQKSAFEAEKPEDLENLFKSDADKNDEFNAKAETKRSIGKYFKNLFRIFVFGATMAVAAGLAGVASIALYIYQLAEELPRYDHLKKYNPPIMTRVHASDGELIAEYAREQRLFIPIDVIPEQLIEAFLSVEDHRFYKHHGIDPLGIARAVVVNIQNYGTGKRLVGASTITQQVAKNYLLSSEVSFERKLSEMVLAFRLEQELTKKQILELYLNGIYLGAGTYGVGAAALTYFNKSLRELNLEEMAFLAALPRSPSNYDPVKYPDRAVERRNWVHERMLINNKITQQKYDSAVASDLFVVMRPFGIKDQSDAYYAEEVRRRLEAKYGRTKLYEGGLSVQTSLNSELQRIARNALRNGMANFEQEHKGYRGVLTSLGASRLGIKQFRELDAPGDLSPWHIGLVTSVGDYGVNILVRVEDKSSRSSKPRLKKGYIARENLVWAIKPDPDVIAEKIAILEKASIDQAIADGQDPEDPFFSPPPRPILPEEQITLTPEDASPADILKVGDVIVVRPDADFDPLSDKVPEEWILSQFPRIEGAIMALDPHTGRVLAMVGGFSFDQSSFNRAVQAKRQPGSAFKPFVYLTALENDLTPSTVLSDSPLLLDQGEEWGYWRPKNYSGNFIGKSTLRRGVEKSRNLMTVRLAQLIGTKKILNTAHKFGLGKNWRNIPSIVLGSGETNLTELVRGYGMLANGGKKIEATFIDQVQDKNGITILRSDSRKCNNCNNINFSHQQLPALKDNREIVVDAASAYQITSMLEGVVQNGTGRILKDLGKPIAGKTGTTNEEKDSWFIGFTPNMVVGVYFGYDSPRTMGKFGSGSSLAAPVVREVFKKALENKPGIPFRVPEGIQFYRIKADDGTLAQPQDTNVILEAFKQNQFPISNSGLQIVKQGSSTPSRRQQSVEFIQTDQDTENMQLAPGGLY